MEDVPAPQEPQPFSDSDEDGGSLPPPADDSNVEEEESEEEDVPAPPPQPQSDGNVATPTIEPPAHNDAPPAPAPVVAVPILRGAVQKNAAGLWSIKGQWTMTETDTISSEFEFVKRTEPPQAVAPPVESPPEPTAARAGDASDALLSGIYDGYFMMKRLGMAEAKVLEHGVKFTVRPVNDGEVVEHAGVSTQLQPGDWFVFGAGENEFGTFELRGRYIPSESRVILGKAYITVKALSPIGSHAKKMFNKPKHTASAVPKRPAAPKPIGAPSSKPRAPRAPPVPLTPLPLGEREQRKRAVPTHLRDAFIGAGSASASLALCGKILDQLMAHQFAYPFMQPVDPVALGIPDYPRVIKRPMDLGTIKHKLDNGAYMSAEEFADDARTTFNNAMVYNVPGTDIYNMADRLKKKFDEQWRVLVRQVDGSNGGGGFDYSEDDSPKAVKKAPASSSRPAASKPRPPQAAPTKKRVRPPAEPAPAKRAAPAPPPAMPYTDPSFGVSNTEVLELKSELQALRMQLRMMAAMTANAQMAAMPAVKVGELTYEEKRELSMRINQLDADKLAKVVQIIAERMPLGSHSASEDIEIDIDALDVETLRRLQDFVKAGAPKPKRAAPPAKTKQELLKAVQQESEANRQRVLAMEKAAVAAASAPAAALRPVGGYGSDSDSDDDDIAPPPPPPPGARF